MNSYTKLYIGTGLVYVLLVLAAATSAYAVTAETLFPEKLDGMVMNGTYARKGTIGATFINVLTLDKLFLSGGSEKEVSAIVKDQRGLGAALNSIGLFGIQPLEGWLNDEKRQGKIMVAVLTLQECPELVTESVRRRLQELSTTSHPLVKAEIVKVVG